MKKISEYFRSPYWKKAKNVLIDIVYIIYGSVMIYGLVDLVVMAATGNAMSAAMIVFPEAFCVFIIVVGVISFVLDD